MSPARYWQSIQWTVKKIMHHDQVSFISDIYMCVCIQFNIWKFTDPEKPWTKYTMIKTMKKTAIERLYLKCDKNNLWQMCCQHHIKWQKLKASSKVRNKTRIFIITILFDIVLKIVRQEKETKGICIRKKEVKTIIICTWHDPLLTILKNTKRLLQLIIKFGDVTE